ncbi:MAG: hypothetical protein GY780_05750 [bacterium]|nr:hypothetical protein [bacterium]
MAPYLIALFFVIIIVFAIYAWQQEQKRRAALRHWCRRQGWKMLDHSIQGWNRDYPGIKLFQRGRGREGDNIITGHFRDRPVTLLDYEYVTGSGKNRTTHRHGVTLLSCDFPTIPLQIRREHIFDKVGEFIGAGDINFESAEFSRKFYVKSADRKWAYDVIHTRTMEYLLQAPEYSVEFGFGEIAIIKTGRCNGEHYEEMVAMAMKLHDLIPDYVIKAMKGS